MTLFPSMERKDFPRGRARNARAMTAHHTRGFGFPVYDLRWDLERVVRDGLERSIWVFRAIDAIAGNGAALRAMFRQGNDFESGVEYEATDRIDLRLLSLLNRRPNPYETARQFKYRLITQFLLSKKGVFIEVVPSRGGGPAAFYLLPPDRTAPIPHKTRFIEGFRLMHGDGETQDLSPDRVLWLRKPHPTDPYSSLTPAEAAGIEIDTDFYMRLFNRNFMANDGRPGGIVAVKGQMAPDVRDELESRFNGGQPGHVTVVESEKLDYTDFAQTAREAQFVESRKLSKEDLLLAFGVPESVLGNASGRTFDNADAEEETFWRHTMREKLSFVYETFDRLTSGGDEDDLFLGADYSTINVMQRDEREKASRLKAEFENGEITLNDYLEGTGREPLDVPEARVHWVAAQGKIPIAANDADEKAALELLQAANPQPAESGAEAGGGSPGGATPLSPPGRTPSTRSEPPKLRAVKSLVAPGGSGPNGELLPTDMTDAERALFESGRTPEDIAESRRAAAALTEARRGA